MVTHDYLILFSQSKTGGRSSLRNSYNSSKNKGKSAVSSQRSQLQVNYTDSLAEMTKSLTIYDQMLAIKRKEREDLEEHIHELKLEIKHTKESRKKAVAIESDLFRENKKVKRVTKRKYQDSFFFRKEIAEIK